ncbi:MAG TPA: 1,4-alpha-glucan branching protein domain-containing protein [Solirubrobacteraceae bacterium]|jgi:1,4-alpha-glucan branching enzyme
MSGDLALVLHTHMPYVEGFGTWPFGEEWLFEAMATSYLPLLDVLERDAPLTLSLTPVLCDQLQAPGVTERFAEFIRGVRRASHRLDAEAARRQGDEEVARAIEHSAARYDDALARFERLDGDLLGALAPHATWTSAATHAVLPLLATDAGVRLQVRSGIESHRHRTGGWAGGFWLPECAHAPRLDPLLAGEGVCATCVDLTGVVDDPLRPLRSDAGIVLWPIDRTIVELVWSPQGYPSRDAYRDSWRKTEHEHRPWAVDGAVYDPGRAQRQARADAADFVARVRERVRDGGVCVCALDTELLGHWWHEGVAWLAFVVEEARAQGLPLTRLDEALETHEAVPAPARLPTTTWGAGRDLSTWDAPAVADLAWAARRAELDVVAAGRDVPLAAVRELLALQSSDWAFQITRDYAPPYGRQRARGHAAGVAAALAEAQTTVPELRRLAPWATAAPLLEP